MHLKNNFTELDRTIWLCHELRIKYLAYTLGHAIGREQYELVERDYKFLKMIPEDVQKARSMI